MVERVAGSTFIGGLRRTVMLASASVLLAMVLAAVGAREADASYSSGIADGDGYVPVYSTCYAGNQLGYYSWYFDGYTTYGTVYVNDCALQALGAGAYDRQRVIEHEMGHARGLLHSPNPYDVMYPTSEITGT